MTVEKSASAEPTGVAGPTTDAPRPQGRYVTALVHDGIVYSAGMTPRDSAGRLLLRGAIGAEVSAEQARSAAGVAAGNALRAVADAAGGLDNVERCLRMTVYLACTPDFADHSVVADGASEALRDRLGERATVVRSAVGVACLPSQAPVEVELTAALRRSR